MNPNNRKNADFIIIGAAKCGTTSLYKRLSMHPDVFMATPKEPEFFARDDIFNKGIEWYLNLFSTAEEQQVCGEASTVYSMTTCFPETVSRMHCMLPNTKIIYVLRDPVDRAYSYYTQLVKNYQTATRDFSVNRSFEECLFPESHLNRQSRNKFFAPYDLHLTDEPKTFIDGSLYMTTINTYLKFYERENLLLIRFEDLVDNIDAVVAKVCDFLDIDSSLLPVVDTVRENISSEHFVKIDDEIYKQSVIEKFKSIRLLNILSKAIPSNIRRAIIDQYSSMISKTNSNVRPEKMDDSTKTYLKKIFREEIEELEEFWGENLESWK